jgi:hypothetical protein
MKNEKRKVPTKQTRLDGTFHFSFITFHSKEDPSV